MAKKKQRKHKPEQAPRLMPSEEALLAPEVDAPPEDARIQVRVLQSEDYQAVAELQRLGFKGIFQPWTKAQFQRQVTTFPEGQLGIELDGELVATSSAILRRRDHIADQHDFVDACADGDFSNHEPDGDTLYGIDIVVAPDQRGQRLARRLYDSRKQLVADLNLRSMLIAGRMPGYSKHAKKLSPDDYLESVLSARLRDPVILAQVANGFIVHHVVRDYLPEDRESCGHAVLMEWLNPDYLPVRDSQESTRRIIDDVRVASVQYQMRSIATFAEFERNCEFFVETASDYRSDFICFPELLTTQLLGLEKPMGAIEDARRLGQYTQQYCDLFTGLAMRYNVNIVGGSHLEIDEQDRLLNVAYLFRRDGSVGRQAKLHITPAEATWWGVSAGSAIEVFDTDCGKIAILICYDIEFPELARLVTQAGARLIFVPFNTDIRPAYMRVRSCAQARCIENNVYCVLSGVCGNLPQVQGVDIHYAQSCILTPCDIPYARDGIGAEATPNAETLLVHELDLSLLRWGLQEGATRNWFDRRTDLYRIESGGQSV